MLDVAVIVQNVYLQMYGDDIPIYINSTEIWSDDDNLMAKNSANNNAITNSVGKKLRIEFNKELKDGIKDIFNYLEAKSCPK